MPLDLRSVDEPEEIMKDWGNAEIGGLTEIY